MDVHCIMLLRKYDFRIIYFTGAFIKETKAFTEIEKGKSVIKVKCGFYGSGRNYWHPYISFKKYTISSRNFANENIF